MKNKLFKSIAALLIVSMFIPCISVMAEDVDFDNNENYESSEYYEYSEDYGYYDDYDPLYEYIRETPENQLTEYFKLYKAAREGIITVFYNGTPIEFPYGKPQIYEGRTMVPVRQTLETMGAEVTYEDQIVRAKKGDITLEYKLNSDSVKKTVGDESETIKFDVPTIVTEEGSSLVPVRFFAEALGLSVTWDDSLKSVIIMDFGAYIDELFDKAPVIEKLLSLGLKSPESYRYNGIINCKLNFESEYLFSTEKINGNIEIKVNEVSNKNLSKGNISIVLSDSLITEILYEIEEVEELKFYQNILKNLNFKYVVEKDKNITYFHSDIIKAIADHSNLNFGEDFKNTWIKFDLNKYYENMGIDLAQLSSLNSIDSKDTLISVLNSNTYDYFSMKEIDNLFDIISEVLGNDNLKLESSENNTYKMIVDIDTDDFIGIIKKSMENQGYELTEEDLAELETLVYEIKGSSTIKDGITTDSTASIVFYINSNGQVISFDVTADEKYTDINNVNETIEVPTQVLDLLKLFDL